MSTTFDTWEFQTRLALARRQVTSHVADPLIADARCHWEASGQTAEESLGTPAEFADAAAAEQPVGYTATRDREGQTPGSYITGTLFALSLVVIPWSLIVCLIDGSWSVAITPARIVGVASYALVVVWLFGLSRSLRAAGHPRLAPWAMAATLVPMVATYLAFRGLSQHRLVTLPVLALDVVAAALAVSLIWRGKPAPSTDRSTRGGPVEPHRWFARCEGLLEGRHDLPRARAAALVQQSRTHLSSEPAAEFGSPDVYADELARAETTHHVPAWLSADTPLLLVFSIIVGWHQLSQWFTDGHVWRVLALLALGALVVARRGLSAVRTARSGGSTGKSFFLRGTS